MSGLTSTDKELGFTASSVPQSGAQHASGTAEPVPTRSDAAPATGAHSQSASHSNPHTQPHAQAHKYQLPPGASVLDQGSEHSMVTEAERDAASIGEPGMTRIIKPTHGGDPETVVNDPNIPDSAKDAPWFGVPPAEGVPFKEQVKGNALYYRGKFFNDTDKVQQGAAELRGDVE